MRHALLVLCCALTCLHAQDTTVLLLRHAEKVSEAPDAELSPAGLARAEAWAERLAKLKPAALFASDRKRTQQTLAPLAARLKVPVVARPATDVQALVEEIRKQHAGRTVVVCGHSNTLAPLAKALGVPAPEWPGTVYDRLWILRIPEKGESSLREE